MKTYLLLYIVLFISMGAYSQIPTNGLIAYYPFCGTANDLSGNGNNLIDSSATLTYDRFSNYHAAYQFNGTTSYLSRNAVFPLNADMSFSCWLLADTLQDGVVVYNGNTNSDGIGIVFGSGNNTPGRKVYALAGGISVLIADTTSLHVWHHVVLRRASGTFNLFIDTVNVGSSTGTFNTATGKFSLGMDYTNSTNPFVGKIDDVAMYNRALSDSEIKALFVAGTVLATTVSSNSPLCAGDTLKLFGTAFPATSVTYNWTGPGSFSSTQQNPIVANVTTAAAGTYFLNDTFQNACNGHVSITVSVNTPPLHSLSSNSPLCPGSTLIFTNSTSNVNVYHWTGPNGFASGLQNPQISNVHTANAGTYYVIDSFLNGCRGKDSIVVSLNIPPAHPTAGSNSPLCSGNTLLLTASDTSTGVSYSWSGPVGFTSTTQNPQRLNAQPSYSGTYTVTVSLNGCTDTANTYVQVNINPGAPSVSIVVSPGDTVCAGTNLTFTATASNISNPVFQWRRNGTNMGPNSPSFTSSSINNNDIITCKVISNNICQHPDTGISNSITMHILALSPPGLTLTRFPVNYINGDTVTFTGHPSTSTGLTYKWTKNGIVIPGAITSIYTTSNVQAGDIICLTIHSSVLCTMPDSVMTCNTLTTAVNNLQSTYADIRIHPNPAGSVLYVDATTKVMVDILSLDGRILIRTNAGPIDLSILPTSIYLLRLYDENGLLLKTDKLIKN